MLRAVFFRALQGCWQFPYQVAVQLLRLQAAAEGQVGDSWLGSEFSEPLMPLHLFIDAKANVPVF